MARNHGAEPVVNLSQMFLPTTTVAVDVVISNYNKTSNAVPCDTFYDCIKQMGIYLTTKVDWVAIVLNVTLTIFVTFILYLLLSYVWEITSYIFPKTISNKRASPPRLSTPQTNSVYVAK